MNPCSYELQGFLRGLGWLTGDIFYLGYRTGDILDRILY